MKTSNKQPNVRSHWFFEKSLFTDMLTSKRLKSQWFSRSLNKGYSILEMLVAVGILAIVGIVVTSSLASSFKNSKKSNAISNVKSDVDYAMSTMERLLRNADSIQSPPPGGSANSLVYTDEHGNTGMTFQCVTPGDYIASGSAVLGFVRLTSSSTVVDCSGSPLFTQGAIVAGVPQVIEINLTGVDKTAGTSVEGASVTSKTRVLLRNYAD